MIQKDWEAWRKTSEGPEKERRLADLVQANEQLVQKFAKRIIENISFYGETLRADVCQAGRIGLLKSIRHWEPRKGAFSTFAWFQMRYEMQLVIRHAAPVSQVRRLLFATNGSRKADAHYAQYGEDPTPAQMGVTEALAKRAAKCKPTYVGLRHIDKQPIEPEDPEITPEGDIDRKRDVAALQRFLATLTKREQREFWTGERPDLTAKAKAWVKLGASK